MSDIPDQDDDLVDRLLAREESKNFECKRIGKVDKLLESVVAFANSSGGVLALGLEDPDKANGRDRVYGIQAHPMNWDEVQRKVRSRITEPDHLPVTFHEIGCVLRDGTVGSIALLKVGASSRVHSIVDNGTFIRLTKGNREISANEITDLCHARGVVSAENQLEEVDFELLETDFWKAYARKRQLTRVIDQAMYHSGLARKDRDGNLKPLRATVLLFAEDPSGLLGSKASIRVFHYEGREISSDPNTNLIRPPATIGGPLISQINKAKELVIQELAGGVQYGPLGFEIVQRYPVRVISEAITNAIIHRDYRAPSDTLIRIFADRIEVESPGLLIGPVKATNIQNIGSHARNTILVQHLREFPDPPNLDAGEGVRMMFGTMHEAGLYPPLYWTRPKLDRDAVRVYLWNNNQPSVWTQVSAHLEMHGTICNSELRQLMGTEDTLRASKQLKEWVTQGLIEVANPYAGRNVRKYRKPGFDSETPLI